MKSKGHLYMANLMLEELKDKGNLFIENNGILEEYKVPQMIKDAVLQYPSYFRAGAVGPDFFPDMLFGQMTIHPENSGAWLTVMYEELCTMPPRDEETKQALAFYLGYMVHYAGDMFTHHYVNFYAKGWFPDFTGIGDDFTNGDYEKATEKLLIILRHLAVEAYMDDYIVSGLETSGHENWVTLEQKVSIPIEYLRSCFGTKAAIQRVAEITGTDADKTDITELDFLKMYVSYLEQYRKDSLQNSDAVNNGSTDMGEDYDNQTREVADNIKKMETMIGLWLQFWETFAQKSIEHGTRTALDESDKELLVLLPEYLTQNEKYLDTYYQIKKVIDFFGAINIYVPVISELFDYIKEAIKDKLKEAAFPYVLHVAKLIVGDEKGKEIDDFDEAIDEIKEAFLNPIHLINNPNIFDEPMLADKLRAEWDNLGKIVDGNGITFLPFYRGYTMGKLCMVGVDELNGIMKRYGQQECFQKGKLAPAIHKLRVVVNTSNANYADTNKDVFFRIIRKNGEPVIMALAGGGNNFKKNKRDVFELDLPMTIFLTDIERFEVQLVGENLWIYNEITVSDERTGIILAKGGKKKLYHKEIAIIPLFDNLQEAYRNCTLVNSVFKLGITIKTATELWSGTDNDVKFSIYMRNHSTKEVVLDKSWYNDFENGDLDTYYITLDKPIRLEEIEGFGIRKNGSDDWKIALLIVFDAETSHCLCRAEVNDWVDSEGYKFPVFDISQIQDIDEIREEDIIQRTLVIIKTKKTSWGGTNDDVYLGINCVDANGNLILEKHELNTSWHDDFEQGDTDTFIVRLDQAVKRKNIVSFDLYKKGEDDWCIEYFSVHDLDSMYHFGTADGKWFRSEIDKITITAKR